MKEQPAQQIDDGGPAFPCKDPAGNQWGGMTIRQYYAIHILQGELASIREDADGARLLAKARDKEMSVEDYLADWAFGMADAMIQRGRDG